MTVTTRDTVREQVVVAVHDTVMETKTITHILRQAQDPIEKADTVFTSIVTERDRLRDRTAVKDKEEKLVVRTDTVYVERRDSVLVSEFQGSWTSASAQGLKKSNFVAALKWIFGILCASIVLIIVIWVSRWKMLVG
jgi:hypothetical protein